MQNRNSSTISDKNSNFSDLNDIDLFFISIKEGNIEQFRNFINDENFDFINIKDQDNHTPLHFSAYCNNYLLTELLLVKIKERLEIMFHKQGEESLISIEKNNSMNSSYGLFNNSLRRENFFSFNKKSIISETPSSPRALTEDNENRKNNKKETFNDSLTFSSNYNNLNSDNLNSSNNIIKTESQFFNKLKRFYFVDEKIKNFIKDFVNNKSINGETALHFASENDNIDLLKLLIQFGADLDAKNNKKQTVLHFALKTNLYKNFIYLHDLFPNFFDLSNDKDFFNQTYLHYACKQDLVIAINYLIFNKANLNSLDNDFRSPIFYAVERGN